MDLTREEKELLVQALERKITDLHIAGVSAKEFHDLQDKIINNIIVDSLQKRNELSED